ncbi:hypothetical protein AMTRI_Chr03g49630 [Amborella trichopoda]|uniref:50S ribosomal protein L31 n=1 Tax=Amborella trichopoda TaxID=13333 RepID=W1NHH9_AMBTC|nr:50S ribosomal protein L31, chloroplastic [Amborella trichopoda]ERM94635.1 hypothetical protein AMTR_s00011p00193440 [Amborella trichopoda]|eukprot:XP_006878490.1 50S ribosomal protein L31, chloroplastic [Amborella trichopoda]
MASLSITNALNPLLNKPSQPTLKVNMGQGKWTCKKPDIHPQFYEDAKVYCNGEHVFTTGGTKPEYAVDVWSGNHPFYLGNRSALVVDDDQVEKFRKKFGALSDLMEIPVLKYGEIILPTKKKSAKGKGKK